MKKIIVLKSLCLLLFCLMVQLGFSQPIPAQEGCTPKSNITNGSYHSTQLIIEIDPAASTSGTETGTAAFELLGGTAIDSIIDSTLFSIYLVDFDLSNSFFSSIKEAHDFFECGEGVGPQGHVHKTKRSDYNYFLKTNYSTIEGGLYDYQNYFPYTNCQEPYVGVPTINNPCNDIKIAVVDSGQNPGTSFDWRILTSEGYDFVDDDPIAVGQHPHWTMVTSIIAAETFKNEEAIKFIPVRVLDDEGEGRLWQFFKGFVYGIDHAEIVVVALEAILCEDDICTIIYESLLEKAELQNTLIVASAGNSDLNIDPFHNYAIPGSGQGGSLIVVGASSCFQNPASFSNIGAINVDLFAPGEDITVYPNLLATGTSFAAPQIASVAATVSLTSNEFSAEAVRHFVMSNVIDRNWSDECFTGGTFDYSAGFGACGGKPKNQNNNIEVDQMKASLSMNAYFSTNDLSVSVNSTKEQKATFQVIDLSGSVILGQNVVLETGNNNFKLNNSTLEQVETGLFFLILRTETGFTLSQKCIKTP